YSVPREPPILLGGLTLMKKLSIALAALAAAAFSLPALAVDSSSPKDDKSTHKDAVQSKTDAKTDANGAGAGGTADTKTSKKPKKAKKVKSDTNAGAGSTTAGQQKSGAADNKATSGTSSPTKP